MKLAMRLFQEQDDYWRIREFLRRVFALNNRRELSWQVYRLDYWRWHGIENSGHGKMEQDVFIWEATDGQIAAVLNPESPGTAFLQVHPGLRTRALEEEMLTVAEAHLATTRGDSLRKLWVFCHGDDHVRQDVLSRRGYTQTDFTEHHHHLLLSGTDAEPLPDVSVPAGYRVRALGDVDELPARSWASWKAFHPDDPDDRYEGWEWYRNIQRAPLYRRDLDIVAVAPDGEIASFCTIWFDDVNRIGAFEPVGTAPAHQRRGLGKAIIHEGLRRLKVLGAVEACVGSEAPETFTFYSAIGLKSTGFTKAWEIEL